jgi:SAM-dependent methyltransferase
MGDYDRLVTAHYDRVAEHFGDSPASTMADEIIRAKETTVITSFVTAASNVLQAGDEALAVLDAGCGNGYTISELACALPKHRYFGVEFNDKLRNIAATRCSTFGNVRILPGDLRNADSIAIGAGTIDVLVCQRVLINLMDRVDQRKGLDAIVGLVRPGGALLFVEVFQSGGQRLNEARAEFGLPPIPPAIHNLPLPDAFFDHPQLQPCESGALAVSENLFSTHYFVSRVLHDLALKAAGSADFKRNSHFVRFMSAALPDGVGDYSPLRVKTFMRCS